VNSLLTSVVVLISAQGSTQIQAVAPGEPRQIAEAAMAYVAREDMNGLFEFIGKNMPMEKAELDKIRDTTITQRKQLPKAIGAYVGYAFISECRKASTLSRVLMIEKRAKHGVSWQFIFYKPRDKWQIDSFKWDASEPPAAMFAPC
jgi:hypothetical protein